MKPKLSPAGPVRRRVFFFLWLLVCAVTGWGAETPAAERLDLATAVRLALAVDPQITKAEAGVRQAESAVNTALAALAPGVTVRAVHQREFDGVEGRVTQLSLVISSTRPGVFPLTIGSKAATELETALWDRADAEAALEQAKIGVALAVAQKYLAALTAEENLRLAEEALRLAQEDERIARVNLEAGVVTGLDVLKAENNTKKAALALERARAQRDLAFDALLLQLGRPFGEALVLAAPPVPATLPSVDLEDLLGTALKTRGEIRQARTNLRKLEANLTRLKNTTLPAVKITATENQGIYTAKITLDLVTGDIQWSLGGNWEEAVPSRPSSWTGTTTGEGLSLGLEFSWMPFDGGARKAQITALEAQLASARASLAKMEKEIELEIRQRVSDLHLAFKALEEAKAQKELALKARELAALRYREGLALFTELEEATQALAQAELAVAQAEYDLFLAMVRLEAAGGRMPELA